MADVAYFEAKPGQKKKSNILLVTINYFLIGLNFSVFNYSDNEYTERV